MIKVTLLITGLFFPIIAAAIPPVPEIPAFPVIESGGNTYHVHNRLGNDVKNDGSAERPWRTFKLAAGKLRVGDTLIVHGTMIAYQMDWASLVGSGNEKQWITIQGENGINGEKVIFAGRLSFGDPHRATASFVYLKNILFQGPGASGINIMLYQDSHHLAFEHIEIDCQSDPMNERGVWTGDNVHHVWFKDMNVHHCGYQRDSPTDCGGICIKGNGVDEVVFLNVRAADNVGDGIGGGSKKTDGNSYFKGCISERNTGDGIDVGGIRAIITSSISRDNGGHQGVGFKFWAKESWLISSVASRNYYNGISVKPRHDGDHHAFVLNSTFALNIANRYGGQVGTTPGLPDKGKLFFHIHNNIFYTLNASAIVLDNVNTQIIKDESHNYYFSVYDSSLHPHWTYAHAIHFRDGNMKVVRGYSFPEMNDKGKWSANTGDGAGNIGEVGKPGRMNPGFLNLSGGDLRLARESLAIDAGIDVGVRSDIIGSLVPFGRAPDMGAYEFSDQ